MTGDSEDKVRKALVMLSALKDNVSSLGDNVDKKYVHEFHTVLDTLQSIGIDYPESRIPDSEVGPIPPAVVQDFRPSHQQRGSGTRQTNYSEERYVDKALLLTKISATIGYLETRSIGGRDDALATLELILSRFHQVATQLRRRHDSRPPLKMNDEYDVQDLLHALLRLHFDDVRAEECTPSYAGGAGRMDFLLKNEQVGIEVKRTSNDLRDKQVGDQLDVDIPRYKEHSDCRTLVCFVYDPEGNVRNPVGLENDLGKQSTESLNVSVHVFPK